MSNVEGDNGDGISVESGSIKEVDEYIYLGKTVSPKNRLENEMRARRTNMRGGNFGFC